MSALGSGDRDPTVQAIMEAAGEMHRTIARGVCVACGAWPRGAFGLRCRACDDARSKAHRAPWREDDESSRGEREGSAVHAAPAAEARPDGEPDGASWSLRGHYRITCRGCGVVLAQCRCPGPKQDETGVCAVCRQQPILPQRRPSLDRLPREVNRVIDHGACRART